MQPVSHIIFDMDGLLLGTEELYFEINTKLARKFDKNYTWNLHASQMGQKALCCAKIIIDQLQLCISEEEFVSLGDELRKEYFPRAKIMPDTLDLYLTCHNNVLSKYDKSITWNVLANNSGMKCLDVCEKFCKDYDLPFSASEYDNLVSESYPKVLKSTSLMRGADRLVKHLAKHNIPIAIASGSSQESFDLKTTNHKEFISHFHHVVLSSSDPEVKKGKPAPDVFQICADRFPDKPAYSKCLVFEDAPLGVTAGVSAGMQVVMVPDSRMDPNLTKEANIVLTSLEEFKPELFGLPAFD